MYISYIKLLLCLYLFLTPQTYGFDCIDEDGFPVDYWVSIKKPQSLSYFYYDSNKKIFNLSPNSLNDTTTGALAYTTKQLFHSDANYVIYNDQPPNINILNYSTTKFGHTKGYFAFQTDTNDSGFLLSHSIPLFPIGPTLTKKYLGLGANVWTYAQNLLCISLSANVLDELSKRFQLYRPNIYDAQLKMNSYQNIQKLIDGEYSKLKVCEKTIFITREKNLFTMYSKSAEWNNDLYSGCVSQNEEDTLYVESWIRGSAEGPVCPITNYDTLDIKYLNFGILGEWSETKDHSKWAITMNKHVICMGDINRMTTQYTRGGGTICFVDDILHQVLSSAITETDSCNLKDELL